MSQRDFAFPISTRLRDAKRLLGALRDETDGPPAARRLGRTPTDPSQPLIAFAPGFESQITLVEKGGATQGAAIGTLGKLTQEQALAFTDLERLMAGARRAAGLTCPSSDVRLRSEFQVGVHDPQDLASELERAGKIYAACVTHGPALGDHGWLAEDTTALATAIASLGGTEDEQEATMDKK